MIYIYLVNVELFLDLLQSIGRSIDESRLDEVVDRKRRRDRADFFYFDERTLLLRLALLENE